MSRERNKYIVGRNSLPAVIRDLVNLNIDNSINIQNQEIDNESNENVVFYKKPQFLGLPKEFINNPSKVFKNSIFLIFHDIKIYYKDYS